MLFLSYQIPSEGEMQQSYNYCNNALGQRKLSTRLKEVETDSEYCHFFLARITLISFVILGPQSTSSCHYWTDVEPS